MAIRPNESFSGCKADRKNQNLTILLKTLRDSIDLRRLIGLNTDALKKSDINNQFLGFIQHLALDSIAMSVCKIYEDSQRNELDSIPAIIKALPEVSDLTANQQKRLTEFGLRYGNSYKFTTAKSYLKGTLGLFLGIHSESFKMFKTYRDQIGAHRDSKKANDHLPSDAEFEVFFIFAENFYKIVSDTIMKIGPAKIDRKTGEGFIELMKSMGIDSPIEDFTD